MHVSRARSSRLNRPVVRLPVDREPRTNLALHAERVRGFFRGSTMNLCRVVLAAAFVVAACGSGLSESSSQSRSSAASASTCVEFCTLLAPGPLRGHCFADAAHGTGLCAQCQGDVNALCGLAAGVEPFCCAPGEFCTNGTCAAACSPTEGASCGSGQPPCCPPLTCAADITGAYTCTAPAAP